MRILKGYSKEECKELEEGKNDYFGSAIELIRGIVTGNNHCFYLARKYLFEDPDKNNQLARDIADFYAGVAKFAEQRYYVRLIRNNGGGYLNRNRVSNSCMTNSCQPCEDFQTEFTELEIKAIDPRYMEFAIPVEADPVEADNE